MKNSRSDAPRDPQAHSRGRHHYAPTVQVIRDVSGFKLRRSTGDGSGLVRFQLLVAVSLLVGGLSGCAALTFPVSGIPAHRVPEELLGEPKDLTETIDLALLGQPAADQYRLAPRDVLGVWIDGILGDRAQAPPIHYSVQKTVAPGLGFPIQVRENGTISLPLVPPIQVAGLSVQEAEAAVVRAYTIENLLLQPGVDRIMVTLIQPRTYRVLVMRQESIGGATIIENDIVTNQRRGTGHQLELQAYENDVLTALSRTGGLPGLEAFNKVVIERNVSRIPTGALAAPGELPPMGGSRRRIEIPLRTLPGEPLQFGPEDVILHDGDVVFVEARDHEKFYTGGLLPTGQYTLPRDYDLDVIEAISMVNGTIANGGFQTNSVFISSFLESGIGGPSPSLVVVLRRTPDGGQVPIQVDLNRALRDSRERILIQPGDVILMQETPGEAVARYASRAFTFFGDWRIWDRGDSSGLAAVALP